LTEEITCTNEMSKETTSENICQKRPPRSGGTPGQATRGTCRLGRCRQGPAANAHAGMLPFHAGMSRWQRVASVIAGTLACFETLFDTENKPLKTRVPPPPLPACATWTCRACHWREGPLRCWHGNMPGLALAAGWCRLWHWRHVPRVASAGVPPFAGGSF
jgi:hypothetical protein